MIGDFVAPCTYVCVVTAAVYRRAGAPDDTRPGPRCGFSDSEPLTVSVVAAPVGPDAGTRGLASPPP